MSDHNKDTNFHPASLEVRDVIKEMKVLLNTVYNEREQVFLCRIFLEQVLGKTYPQILTEPITLNKDRLQQISIYIDQALRNMPWQYILGSITFCGLEIEVSPDVLIPRPETEELAHLIIRDLSEASNSKEAFRIIDVASGSGCLGMALAKAFPTAELIGVELSQGAIELAQKNSLKNGLHIDYIQTDVLKLPDASLGKFSVLVSNPPYVLRSEASEMQANVKLYEPEMALYVPDDNPLLFYKALLDWCDRILLPDALIYLEVNERYGKQTAQLFSNAGYVDVQLKQDFRGKDRFVSARFVE